LREQLLEPADEGDRMTANHKPQHDYVIEAINDLLADEEAEVLAPAQNHHRGARQTPLYSDGQLALPRSGFPAEFSPTETGRVISIREAPRQGRR
jgi:hypothetical protein